MKKKYFKKVSSLFKNIYFRKIINSTKKIIYTETIYKLFTY